MARISSIGVIIAAALWTAVHAVAQDVNPGEVLERPKNYSPYVERTASDANLAEGVYWATRTCTPPIPPIPACSETPSAPNRRTVSPGARKSCRPRDNEFV